MQNKAEYPERTSDHCFCDLMGIVKPKGPIEEPLEATNALLTIREHLQLAATVLRENKPNLTDDDLNCIAHVLDCLHVGAGYVLEWTQGQATGREASDDS